jgi:hypothetical protein
MINKYWKKHNPLMTKIIIYFGWFYNVITTKNSPRIMICKIKILELQK